MTHSSPEFLAPFEKAVILGSMTSEEPFHVLWHGKKIAVLQASGSWRAFEDRCPHMGSSLLLGDCDGASIVCPWHGWKFDLVSGSCANSAYARLSLLEVEVRGGEVWLREKRAASGHG